MKKPRKSFIFLGAFALANLVLWVVAPSLFGPSEAQDGETVSITETILPALLDKSPTSVLGNNKKRKVKDIGFTFAPNASVEMGKAFGMALKNAEKDFSAHFGRWPLRCDQCTSDCMETATKGLLTSIKEEDDTATTSPNSNNNIMDGEQEQPNLKTNSKSRKNEEKKNEFTLRHEEIDRLAWTTPISHWGPMALQNLVDENLEMWQSTGITMSHHVEMASCSYRTRMHYNPSGFWVHISGHKITRLRLMVDGYDRYKRLFALLKKVVLSNPPLEKAVVAYFSVTDTPCNPTLPYMTAFAKRGVKGILIPDDTFETKPGWNVTRVKLSKIASEYPFDERRLQVLFRASPTHPFRSTFKDQVEQCCGSFANVTLGVMERFKHLILPIEEHVHFKYLGAVRGRTASNRDKYLNLLGGAILRVEEVHPWFQFYHALWKPWLNYIPLKPSQMNCSFEALQSGKYDDVAAKIAQKSREVGEFLTDEVVQGYLYQVLQRYSQMQRYTVADDPLDFLKGMQHFSKKKYPNAQLMPDDRHPVKFVFHKWISRRIRQIVQCRIETRAGQTYDSEGNVLIHGVAGKNRTVPLPPVPGNRCWYL